MMRGLLVLGGVVWCLSVGCSGPMGGGAAVAWRDYYAEASAVAAASRERAAPAEALISCSVAGMPFRDFLRYVASRGGELSIVADASLDDQVVSLEVTGEPVSRVLAAVARRCGVQVTRIGRMYYIGTLRPEDRGLFVRRISRLSAEELADSLGTLVSDNGRVRCYSDGLVVVADRVEVLERVGELCDAIEAAPLGAWVVQAYIVSVGSGDRVKLGLDVTPALDVAYTVAVSGELRSVDVTGTLTGAGGLHALLHAVRESSESRVVAEPLLLMGDGEEGSFISGERVPVPRRTVSDQGTVTIVGYDYVQSGLQVRVVLREAGGSSARLGLDVTMSDVSRMVQEAPVTVERSLKTRVLCQSGVGYLVGTLERRVDSSGWTGTLGLVPDVTHSAESLQVWVRCVRVDARGNQGPTAGPVLSGGERSTPAQPVAAERSGADEPD